MQINISDGGAIVLGLVLVVLAALVVAPEATMSTLEPVTSAVSG